MAEPHLEVIIGPMMSGKTTELFRRLGKHRIATQRTALIKYAKDNRYVKYEDSDVDIAFNNAGSACSHNGVTMKANLALCSLSLTDKDLLQLVNQSDVIGIDEGQFMLGLNDFCSAVVNTMHKTVIVAGLDVDYKGEQFLPITQLVSQAEQVDKLLAVCMECYSANALFSKRIVESDVREVIGGADKYKALCRKCWNLSHISSLKLDFPSVCSNSNSNK